VPPRFATPRLPRADCDLDVRLREVHARAQAPPQTAQLELGEGAGETAEEGPGCCATAGFKIKWTLQAKKYNTPRRHNNNK
jgi:hypothetical protein